MNSKINTPISTVVTTSRSGSHNLVHAWLVFSFCYDGTVTKWPWGLTKGCLVSVQRGPGRSSLWVVGYIQTGLPPLWVLCPVLRWMDIWTFTQHALVSLFDSVSKSLPDWAAVGCSRRKYSHSQNLTPLSRLLVIGVPSRSFLALGGGSWGSTQALNLVNVDIWRKKLFSNIQECAIGVATFNTFTPALFNSEVRITNI